MSEERPEIMYSVKLDAIITYLDGSYEQIKNIDVVRQADNSLILLKDKMSDVDFFRTSIQIPLTSIRKFHTTILEVKEIE